MLRTILLATLLMLATTAIHIGATGLARHIGRRHGGSDLVLHTYWSRFVWLGGIIVLLFLTSILEILCWAVTYLALGAIEGFEPALYFSMVTYTTVGYGDIVLNERFRLLASFEAVNGIIMFGWTTAIVVYAVQQIFPGRNSRLSRSGD